MLLVVAFMIAVTSSCGVISPTSLTTTITNTDQSFNCYTGNGNGGSNCNHGVWDSSIDGNYLYSIRSGNLEWGVNYAESDYCFSNTQSITAIIFKYQYTWWDNGAIWDPANPATLRLILQTDTDQQIWASGSFTPISAPYLYEWESCSCDGCYCAYSPLQSTSFPGLNLDISGKNVNFIINFTLADTNIHLMKSTLEFVVTWETLMPTTSPSNYPSQSPTNNPSKYPTTFPTQSPSTYPSKSPSKTPTKNPSRAPTQQSINPTQTPSMQPTIDNDSAAQVETKPATTSDIDGMKANSTDSSSEFDLYLIYVITACILLFICCALAVFIYKRKRNQKQEMETTLGNTVSVIEMNQNVLNLENAIPETVTNGDSNAVINAEEHAEGKTSQQNLPTSKHAKINSDDIDEFFEDKAGGNICKDQTSGMITHGGDVTNDGADVVDEELGHEEQGNLTLSQRNEPGNDLLAESVNDSEHITATDDGYGKNEKNEDELLDGMLSDIMKMDDLDPNKIHENNMKDLVYRQNNDTDSEDSNNMYEM